MCSRPAFASDLLADATPPDVAGPRTAATCVSEMNFCATFCASPGPFSTGVSPPTIWTLSLSFGPSVFAAYFAHESCSLPMGPPPPVSGVSNGSLIVPLQSTAAIRSAADDPAPAVDASAAAAIATKAMTSPPRLFIRTDLLVDSRVDLDVGIGSRLPRAVRRSVPTPVRDGSLSQATA